MPAARRRVPAALALAAALAFAAASPAQAHHAWRWTTGGTIEVNGIVETARLGAPHGVLSLKVEDKTWTVEVGKPRRNARAGLTDDKLRPGVALVAAREPSADTGQRLVKAASVWVDGARRDLHPERT